MKDGAAFSMNCEPCSNEAFFPGPQERQILVKTEWNKNAVKSTLHRKVILK